jgi:hypothetical protein
MAQRAGTGPSRRTPRTWSSEIVSERPFTGQGIRDDARGSSRHDGVVQSGLRLSELTAWRIRLVPLNAIPTKYPGAGIALRDRTRGRSLPCGSKGVDDSVSS